jgi:hypothetical protein
MSDRRDVVLSTSCFAPKRECYDAKEASFLFVAFTEPCNADHHVIHGSLCSSCYLELNDG